MQTDLRHFINTLPMSRYQWFIVVLSVILTILDGFDAFAIAFTAKSIQNELGLTGAEIGTLMSAGFIGMAMGSLLLAPLADSYGRRPLLIFATALCTVGMLMIYFCHGFYSIGFWRWVTGLGIGIILPCTNVMVSEYTNQKWRSVAMAIYVSGFSVGAVLGGLVAVLLQEKFGFRSVFITGGVLTGLALVVVAKWLPESVAYLHVKQPKDTQQKLISIAKKIDKPTDFVLPKKPLASQKISFLRLFEAKFKRNTLLLWASFITVMSTFYFISSWTPALLEASGLKKSDSQWVGIAILFGGVVGCLLFGVLANRLAIRQLLMIFIGLSSVSIMGFVASPTLTLLLMMAVVVGTMVNACIAGLYMLSPTLYPTELRSTGVGASLGIGRLGSISAPIVAGELLDMGVAKNDLYLGVSGLILFAFFFMWLIKNPD